MLDMAFESVQSDAVELRKRHVGNGFANLLSAKSWMLPKHSSCGSLQMIWQGAVSAFILL
jgi:hypothetical protein